MKSLDPRQEAKILGIPLTEMRGGKRQKIPTKRLVKNINEVHQKLLKQRVDEAKTVIVMCNSLMKTLNPGSSKKANTPYRTPMSTPPKKTTKPKSPPRAPPPPPPPPPPPMMKANPKAALMNALKKDPKFQLQKQKANNSK